MDQLYSVIAIFASYFFAGLMVLIVFRAFRATMFDNRRAKVLRSWSPETGCVGELLINPGGKKRLSALIPKEGVLGRSAKADIRLKYKDVSPMHAHIEQREGGLLIRPLGRARIALGEGAFTGEQLFAQDGDVLMIGKQRLLIVLFDPAAKKAAQKKPAPAQSAEPYDDPDDDPFFDEERLWQEETK